MRRSAILIAVCALVATLVPTTPVARAVTPQADQSFTANFEATGGISVGDEITNQYPFVTFDSFHATGYGFGFASTPSNNVIVAASSNPVILASGAHAGSDSGQVVCGVEFCQPGTFGVLNYTADSISVYAGSETTASTTVELDAYQSNGDYISSDVESTSATGARTLLSIAAPTGKSIGFFDVYLGSHNQENLDIDDLTITVPAGAVPAVGVSATAASYEIGQDGTISIPLTIHRINGASAAVALDVEGFTAKVTGSATDPGMGTTSTLMVSASHTAPLTEVDLTVTASALDANSQPALALSIIVIPPLSFAAPTKVTSQTCESNTIDVEADVAPGEPGTEVDYSTSFSGPAPGLTASATTPITISGGLAPTTVHLSNTGGAGNNTLFVNATLSNGDNSSVTIKLIREGPSITAVADKKAATPRAGGAGTTIEVYGHGFCNTATVYVGNDKAPVTATVQHLTGNQGPFDYIRITTPRHATTGTVIVQAGSPAVAGDASTDKVTVDSYRNVDGWNFHNFDPDLDLDDLTQAYGSDQTYIHVDPCSFFTLGFAHCSADIVPDPIALVLLGIAQASMSDGTCFGFSLSTQRILEGEVALSSLGDHPADIFDAPAPDTSATAQGSHGQQPVLDLLKSVHLMQLSVQFATQFTGEFGALEVSNPSDVSNELATDINTIFSKGRYPLIEISDGGGHVLVAYDMEQTGPGAYDIYVYDSNDQFTPDEDTDSATHVTRMDSSVIHLAADGTWSLASTTQSDNSPWHGGIGQLIVTDPDTIPLHPTLPSLGGGAPPGLLFSSNGGSGSSGRDVASSARITQVSSGGRTFYSSPGVVNTNPTSRLNAAPFGPFVGAKTEPKGKIPQLIAVGGGATNVKVASDGKSTGSAAMTFVQGQYAGEVKGSTTSGAAQTESFGSHLGSVGFTGSSNSPVTLDVSRAASSSQHSVDVTLAHAGTADQLTLGSGNGAVRLSHSGKATSFTLTMSGAQSHGLPQTFSSGSIKIGAKQTATITAPHWGALGGATLKLRVGKHTVTLHNHTKKPKGARISNLRVTSTHKHPHKLSFHVTAKLPRLATGSQAFVIWLVHRGHHLLKRHQVVLRATKRVVNARWTTTLAKAKGLRITAIIVTIAVHGTTERSAAASRSARFAVS